MKEPPYTLRPIVSWPGKFTAYRPEARFSASWNDTLAVLERELKHLRAKQVILQRAVSEEDFRKDGQLRQDARPRHPGVILAFNSIHGPLQYACDRYDDWHDNVRAIALGLEALRKVERYGITKSGEQYAGWKALADGMSRQQAEDLLASYGGEARALRQTHPDQGGRREDFERVIEARKLVRSD